MTKSYTPPPESPRAQMRFGCGVTWLFITLVVFALAWYTKWWSLIAFCVPAVFIVLSWLSGKILLLKAAFTYRRRGIAGILVTSDSPNWNVYVKTNWIERYPGRFIVLNWSERKQWPHNLASGLYWRLLSGEQLNVCPVIILLRGLRYPLLFRFFYAFRDHKHGNDKALNALEQRLAQELEKPVQPTSH